MNTENVIELDEDLIEILLQIGWVVKDNHGELMFTVKGEEELMKYVREMEESNED